MAALPRRCAPLVLALALALLLTSCSRRGRGGAGLSTAGSVEHPDSPLQLVNSRPVLKEKVKLAVPSGARLRNTSDGPELTTGYALLIPVTREADEYVIRPVGAQQLRLPYEGAPAALAPGSEMVFPSKQTLGEREAGQALFPGMNYEVVNPKGEVVFRSMPGAK
jgi:hypothetical protein